MPTKTHISQVQEIPEPLQARLGGVERSFAFRATDYYLSLINWADPSDPLRRIVIPTEEELSDYGALDPSNEHDNYVVPGCQHKYRPTALLIVADVCDAYCRFCFRKRLFQRDNHEALLDVAPGLQYISDHPEITNVLLTGGDSLILAPARLDHILTRLRAIPHVGVIRLGSKALAFNPLKITDNDELLDVLRRHSLPDRKVYVMAHYDHPRELTRESREALQALQAAGCTVVHQCPMLRGINDDADVPVALLQQLTDAGVTPYYIFQGRPVKGNEGFVVPLSRGCAIIDETRRRLSGLAKRFRYVMSHDTGKVEVLGASDGEIYLKYHEARDPENEGRLFHAPLPGDAAWLDDLPLTVPSSAVYA